MFYCSELEALCKENEYCRNERKGVMWNTFIIHGRWRSKQYDALYMYACMFVLRFLQCNKICVLFCYSKVLYAGGVPNLELRCVSYLGGLFWVKCALGKAYRSRHKYVLKFVIHWMGQPYLIMPHGIHTLATCQCCVFVLEFQ